MLSLQFSAITLLSLLTSICLTTPLPQDGLAQLNNNGGSDPHGNHTVDLAASKHQLPSDYEMYPDNAEYDVPETGYRLSYKSWPEGYSYRHVIVPLDDIQACVERGVKILDGLIASRSENHYFDYKEGISPAERGWFLTDRVYIRFTDLVNKPTYGDARHLLQGILAAAEHKDYRETANINATNIIQGHRLPVAKVSFTVPEKTL